MKNRRSRFSNLFILVILVGLTVAITAVFSNPGLRGPGPTFSPVVTDVVSQASPLPTLETTGVPIARIEKPIQLTNSPGIRLIGENQGKITGIVGKGDTGRTVLLELPQGEERTLADRILFDAQVSGDWLMYIEESAPSASKYTSRIKIRNLKTQQEIVLGNEGNIQNDLDVSGDILVWNDARNGNKSEAGIYAYDLKGGREFSVIMGQPKIGYPRISGEWIVYLHFPDERTYAVELRAHSLQTGEDFAIGLIPNSQDSYFGTRYIIDDDKVAWTKYDPNQFLGELHLYDWTLAK